MVWEGGDREGPPYPDQHLFVDPARADGDLNGEAGATTEGRCDEVVPGPRGGTTTMTEAGLVRKTVYSTPAKGEAI